MAVDVRAEPRSQQRPRRTDDRDALAGDETGEAGISIAGPETAANPPDVGTNVIASDGPLLRRRVARSPCE